MNHLRLWLAYYIMPKDIRKHLIKALLDSTKELKKEVTDLHDYFEEKESIGSIYCRECVKADNCMENE